jgi:DNA-directed RNA polymerase specialized sigma24 family protein
MSVQRKPVEAYEGLVLTHALRVLGRVGMELDDIRQVYRMKVWYASNKWDPERSKLSQDRFVFGCLKNAEIDLLKRKRHGEVFLEDQSARVRRTHEGRATHEDVYGQVDEGTPLIPNTLTDTELQVIVLLYRGYFQTEIAPLLGLGKTEMETVIRSIRGKMEDWRPGSKTPALHLLADPEVATPIAA